jgi:cytochrome P450
MMKRTHTRSMAGPHLGMLHDVVKRAALTWPVGRPMRVIDALRPIISEQLGRLLASRSGRDMTGDLTQVNRSVTNVFVVKSRPPLTLRLPGFRRALQRVLALGAEVLQEHRTNPRDPASPDFIDDMLAAVAANPELLSEDDLRFAAIGPFVAGLDTVANACSFLLYELLAQPELRARVVAETDAFFDGGELTLEKLRTLRTLTLALMETLRLHPVAPAIMRNAARDFTFAGYSVPEGEPLLIATAVSHFLPQIWANPTEFDLARFESPRNEHRKSGAYAPYGLGPHTCLGASLAEVQVVLLVGALLHTVELRLEPAGYKLRKINSPGPTPDKRFSMSVARVRQV